MIPSKQKVVDICNEVFVQYQQATIDIIEDIQDDLLQQAEVTPDEIGAWSYTVGNVLDIFNPFFESDIELLTRLETALAEWHKDVIKTNFLLNMSKN